MPDEPDPEPARAPDKRCPATIDGSPDRRCHRPLDHEGLHRWEASDGSKKFEWA